MEQVLLFDCQMGFGRIATNFALFFLRRVYVKKQIYLILCALSGIFIQSLDARLEQPPSRVDTYGEIAVIYYDKITEVYDALTPVERVFAYYLYRASLPGHQIALGQFHRKGLEITTLLEKILDHKEMLAKGFGSLSAADAQQFIDEVPIYLVYMWANHGQYFLREFVREKRTPCVVGLKYLTQENVVAALRAIGHAGVDAQVAELAPYLFDETVESTRSTPGFIDKSAINFYAPGFTDDDFDRLSSHEQKHPNGYYSIEERDGQRIPKVELCKVGGRFDQELSVTVHWLEKAAQHAAKYPETFDAHITPSLNLLCEFFRTGDEETFKKHSIEWLKTKSKIDYLYGFMIRTPLNSKNRSLCCQFTPLPLKGPISASS